MCLFDVGLERANTPKFLPLLHASIQQAMQILQDDPISRLDGTAYADLALSGPATPVYRNVIDQM